MAYRKKPGEKRSVPLGKFKLRPEVDFPISGNKSLLDEFDYEVANENRDRSKKLRQFILYKLGCKNESELVKFSKIKKAIKDIKNSVIEELGLEENGFSSFSKMIEEEFIKPYLEELKK